VYKVVKTHKRVIKGVTMFSKIWSWFVGFFKSNKMLLQLSIQALAGEYFKKHPSSKKRIGMISKDVIVQITIGEIVNPEKAFDNFKERITLSDMNPAEKALFYALIDAAKAQMEEYAKKQNITLPSQQVGIVLEIFKWIEEASKF
jgi:hypothetical protein